MNRKNWLITIAHADKSAMLNHWKTLNINTDCQWLREPETGLLPMQARMGNTGNPFQFGDTTITRAVVMTEGKTGYSFILGRNKEHARCAAIIDALMQQTAYTDTILSQVLEPLAIDNEKRQQALAANVAETTVDFFTMVRGE